MGRNVIITYKDGTKREFPVGMSLKELSNYYQNYLKYDILVAKVDNDLAALSDTIARKCKIEFFDRSTTLGRCVYASSANFILVVAVRNALGDDATVVIHHSLDNGVYCHLHNVEVNAEVIKKVEDEMRRLINEDLPFEKISVSRTDAMKYFKSRNKMDKVNVLKYIPNSYVSLYNLDNMYDYYYGKLAYSTGQINNFKLTYMERNGFILSIPSLANPGVTTDYVEHEKISDSFIDLERVANSWGINHVSDLNKIVSDAKVTQLILNSEAYYTNQLQVATDQIIQRKNVRLVLLAGPSSSGKTTTSKRLMTYIKGRGLGVLQISVDNYFVNKVDTPKKENGEYDFESLQAVDLKLFNEHLTRLMAGEEVELPNYNFITGEREFNGNFVKLKDDDIIIIEGIHALNDELTRDIDSKYKYRLYVSPLIHVNIDNHNHIHTTDLRKLRRIVRDSRTRGRGALETLSMWSSIRHGEEEYIYPHQEQADYVINSSLIYEIGVLKTYAEPLLFCVEEDDEVYPEALRLINFLRNFLPIPGDSVPVDSVLREFIGGSCFRD